MKSLLLLEQGKHIFNLTQIPQKDFNFSVGLIVFSTYKQLSVIPEAFSLDIPVELTREMTKAKDNKEALYRIGTEWCTMQCKDLIAHGVPAVHFYTMGKSRKITEILRECF